MNLENKQTNQRKYGLITGITLIIMAFAAMLSYGLVFRSLVVEGDAIATYDNITSSIALFIVGF